MKKSIGIIGGMGPMATCDLMKKIIDNTLATRDQEHIRIFVDCNTNIPDRTAAILQKGIDPRPEMIKSAINLQKMGADVLIMPCNTAHYFLEDVQKSVSVPMLNMLSETAKVLVKQNVKCATVLATDGTIKSGLYDKELKNMGIKPVYPSEEEQKMIMSIIYDFVKAGREFLDIEKIRALEDNLIKQGAQAMILGCTELPIFFEKYQSKIKKIDPTLVLACAAIEFTGNKVKT